MVFRLEEMVGVLTVSAVPRVEVELAVLEQGQESICAFYSLSSRV